MKRIQSILCASLITLAMSSVALAGNISGASEQHLRQHLGQSRQHLGLPGDISGITCDVITGLLNAIVG